jgi:hypothetical protein
MMKKNGADESDIHDFLFSTNKLAVKEFRKIFSDAEFTQVTKIIVKNEWAGVEHDSHLKHPVLEILKQKYNQADLFTRGMNVLFQKVIALAPCEEIQRFDKSAIT